MNENRVSSLYGSLDLLVLKAVANESLHGVGIVRRIRQITADVVDVSYGSLFPALHRMEEKGWLSSEWNASEANRRAKYYKLTAAGKKQLRVEEREWHCLVKAITAALQA